jgi:hypothetical protein
MYTSILSENDSNSSASDTTFSNFDLQLKASVTEYGENEPIYDLCEKLEAAAPEGQSSELVANSSHEGQNE